MELRVRRYFLVVAQEENITQAAKKLHLTQPTLSRQMMLLEQELGVTLFDRGRRRISLTASGLLLRERAAALLALSDKTVEDLASQEETLAGEVVLALGCQAGRNAETLARAMAAFRRRYPQVRFSLPPCDTAALQAGLERGTIDLALWSGTVDASRYEAMPLPHRERWGLLVAASSSWAAETAIPAAALTGLTLLLPQAEEAAQALSAWAAAASVRLSPALRYGQAAWAACAGAGRSWCGPLSRWRGLGSGAALCALGAADGAGDGADMEEKPYARPGCRHIFAVAPALPLSFRFEISVFLPVLPMQNRAFL